MTGIDQCSICLEKLKASIGMLDECKHIFCYDCIKKWSEIKKTCPLDRIPFDTINILHEIGGAVVKEEKLEPRMVDPLDILFQIDYDNEDDIDDYLQLEGLFHSRMARHFSPLHLICHECLGEIASNRVVRCRSCRLSFHTECLIDYLDVTQLCFCPVCYVSMSLMD
nr:PHD and RING finger domain containing protein 1 [Hymenolepis microstoma]